MAPYLNARVVRLAALRQSRIEAAMQVLVHPVGGTDRTFLYVPRGPALMVPRVETLGPLLDAARLVGREERALGIKLEPNAPACDARWKQTLRAMGLRATYPPSQPRSSWILDISRDADSLLADMKQKTRYNIRLAAKKGVEVLEGGADEIDTFYDLYQQTAARDAFSIQPRAFYQRMFALFRRSGNFCMLVARHDEQPLGAITLLRLGPTCWYVHGASSDMHRNLMAAYLLQWEAIQWAKKQGCLIYDFRAVPDILREDQEMYGVYRFKEGFGGRQYTVLPTYAQPYHRGAFGLLQLYVSGRFALDAWLRRRKGLPARQFA